MTIPLEILAVIAFGASAVWYHFTSVNGLRREFDGKLAVMKSERESQVTAARVEFERQLTAYKTECVACRLSQDQRVNQIMNKIDTQKAVTTENDKTLAIIVEQLNGLNRAVESLGTQVTKLSGGMQEMRETIIRIEGDQKI